MLIINVEGKDNLERSLKKLKRKFEQTGAMKEVRRRKEFVKKSVSRRNTIKKAIHVEKLKKMSE